MIEVDQLTKRYSNLTAVDALSFSVEPGQVLGFLGPNGAGKSTTMKMLAGFLTPTSGRAKICGFDVQSDSISAKRSLGYLPEGAPSYGEMSVFQFLNFVADIRGLKASSREKALAMVMDQLHLNGVLHQTIETLSKGFKRRVGLAQALIHDPKVLILDEPTDGLDPNQKHEVRALIEKIASNKTVIISTHILEEVDVICDRAMIIAKGRILADDTPQALAAKSRFHNAVRLTIHNFDEAVAAISALPEVAKLELDAEQQRLLAIPKPGKTPYLSVSELIREKRWDVQELAVESGRLNDVFRQITLGVDGQEVRT